MRTFFTAIVLALYSTAAVYARTGEVWYEENFDNLDNWRPLHFRKIKKHSRYGIKPGGDGNILEAASEASASGLILNRVFKVNEYPRVTWRWKADNVYAGGDATKRSGDDYPLRVYILFKYDPATASAGTRLKYDLIKLLYGEYPPDSSLNYIWANKDHGAAVITNPYADRSKMIVLQAGTVNIGTWQQESIHILKDYRLAFGTDPPATASLAIMSDSDNTGESATAYVDFIRIHK